MPVWRRQLDPALADLKPGERIWTEQIYDEQGKKKFRYCSCTEEDILEYILACEHPRIFEMLLTDVDPVANAGPVRPFLDCEFDGEGPDHHVFTKSIEREFAKRLRAEGATGPLVMKTGYACKPTKYSTHIICFGPWFASIADVGAFVRKWEADELASTDKRFTVNGAFRIDVGIYNPRRNYRLMGNSKIDEWRPLVPLNMDDQTARERCMEFLVQDMQPHADLIYVNELDGGPARTTGHKRNGAPQGKRATKVPRNVSQSAVPRNSLQGIIVEWLRDKCGDKSVHAKGRDDNALFIAAPNTKQCAIAGREHRGNKVFFVVDLNKATARQMCYSEHCEGYAEVEFPPHVRNALQIATLFARKTQPA